MANPDHDELVLRGVRWLQNTVGCGVVFAEINTALPIIPDVIGWKREMSTLVECKTTRSDFLKDKKKVLHLSPDDYPGQRRFYLAPPGLLKVSDLPPGWGLLECYPTRIVVVKDQLDPLLINRRRQAAELPILLSACRRFTLGVEFYPAKGRFKPALVKHPERKRKAG